MNNVAQKLKVDKEVTSAFKLANKYNGWYITQLLSNADEKITALKE